MFVAMLLCAAGFQKSPWCVFVLGQFLLYPSTPVQSSGRGMEIVPAGNYNAVLQRRAPNMFYLRVQPKLLKVVVKFPLNSR